METPNEKVADKITLTKVNCYAAVHTNDDGFTTNLSHFKSSAAANIKAKGIGSWGTDGKVEPVVRHIDERGVLYEVKVIGPYLDISEAEHNEMLNGILSKLSPTEQEFFKNNMKK